ncbi:hypothetical protein F7725_001221 [Dissostichus mawsoni]|uniref:C-type lectin domain-containing protein n=1 Tax=Dissostichus mawsoni TaxID=36200 RepID=A0A7J5ZH65_DISMA|nr:hypothetical protein F7725_001221 [Dissostichus mawsoni]
MEKVLLIIIALSGKTWIGLYDDRDSWKWSMSDPSFYEPGKIEFRQWGSGESGAWHHEQCTFVNSGGTWGDQDCNNRLRVICFDVTGHQYHQRCGIDVRLYVVMPLLSFSGTENQQIVELLPGGYYYWIGLYRDSWKWSQGLDNNIKLVWRKQPDGQSAWIGLHDDRDSWKWSMSDPSFYGPGETEFRPWGVDQPENRPTMTMHTFLFLVEHDCNTRLYVVCFDVTGLGLWSEETVHLLRCCACFNASDKGEGGEPDGVDLNNKAFLDDMLVEAKKNLRAQGLDDNVQLAWRKQPDGQSAWIGLHDDRDSWKWSMSDPSLRTGGDGVQTMGCCACFNASDKGEGGETRRCGSEQKAFLDDMLVELHIYSLIPKERNREETRMEKVLLIIIALSAWIGLHDDRDSWKWSMSDPSYYGPGETEFRRGCCACFNASDKGEGGEPNGVDLNNKAFLDDMLVEAKKNLRAQGLDDNVQLAWRKQPDGQSAWIGLHDDRDSWKWSMSDPSYYGPGETEFRRWGVINQTTPTMNNAHISCACFNASDKGEGGETNGVDLNNKAFLDDMLVEAKKNLRAQGLDDNVQLAWRKQPDGQLHIYSLIPKERNREETRMEKVLLIIIVLSAWIGLHDDRDSWKWSMSDPSYYGPGETEFRRWGVINQTTPTMNNAHIFVLVEHGMIILVIPASMWSALMSQNRSFATDVSKIHSYVKASDDIESVEKEDTINVVTDEVCFCCACFNASDKGEGGRPNGVDLNNKAFLDDMLVEAKKNLRAQGLDDNVQLAWRKQPDGQVFHKEEEKKRDEL